MIKTKYKIIIWHLVIAGLAWGFWGYLDYVLNVITPDSFSFDFEPWQVFNLIIQSSLIVLGLLLFIKKRWAVSIASVVGLMYLLKFGLSYISFLGIAIFILFALHSRKSTIEELQERTKVNSRIIIRRGVTMIILGLFVLISFATYQSPTVQSLKDFDRLPTVSEFFIKRIVDVTISSQIKDIEPEQKDLLLNQTSKEVISSINEFVGPYFKYAPPTLSFTLFLVLLSISWIFIWASVGIGVFIFWLLKKFNVVTIEEVDTKAETIIV
jgi:hypothetical protein